MSVSTSDLLGLLVICVPILVLVIYSVRFSKKSKSKEINENAKEGRE